jgi:hypothetical protein
MLLLYKIIFINGIYDIICGLSILLLPNTYYIANIHPLVFNKEYSNNPLLKRLLAYWILTYGFIRVSIIFPSIIIKILIALSYFIEAYAFAYEYILFKTTLYYKTLWIVSSASLLGFLCLFNI